MGVSRPTRAARPGVRAMTFVDLFAGNRRNIAWTQTSWDALRRASRKSTPTPPASSKKHWPDTPRISDVSDFTGTEFGPYDVLVGGYPCQPFSDAGRRKGEGSIHAIYGPTSGESLATHDPSFVLLENVAAHLRLGFGAVLADLAALGYDAEWDCIPAAAVGAPHIRDRVYVLAYPGGGRLAQRAGVGQGVRAQQQAAAGGRAPQAMADPCREWEQQRARPLGQIRGRTGDGGAPLADPESDAKRAGLRAIAQAQEWRNDLATSVARSKRQWELKPNVGSSRLMGFPTGWTDCAD